MLDPSFCTYILELLILVPCLIDNVYSIVVNVDNATVSTVVIVFEDKVNVVVVPPPPPPVPEGP